MIHKIVSGIAALLLLIAFAPAQKVQAQDLPPVPNIEAIKAPIQLTATSTNYPAFDVYFRTDPTGSIATDEYGEFVRFGNSGSSANSYSIPEDFPFINFFPSYSQDKGIKIARRTSAGTLPSAFDYYTKDFRDTTAYTFVMELGGAVTNISILEASSGNGLLHNAADIVTIYSDSTDKDNTILWETLNGSLSSRSASESLTTFDASSASGDGNTGYIVVEMKTFKEAPGLTALYTTAEANAADGDGNADDDGGSADGIDDTGKGVTYEAGWNMVSIPIAHATGTNNTPVNIFGSAIIDTDVYANAFEYDVTNNLYTQVTTLEAGKGYWIYSGAIAADPGKATRYFGDQDLTTYEPLFTVSTPTIPSNEYVMIGGTATPTPISTSDIATSAIWTWNDGGYRNAANTSDDANYVSGSSSTIETADSKYILRPGKGYWVQGTGATADLSADIFLQQSTTSGAGASFAPKRSLDFGDRITVTHGQNQNIQDLFLGAEKSINTPPFPPQTFQATFSGTDLVSEYFAETIQIREATEDVVISFEPTMATTKLSVRFDNEVHELASGSSITISARGNFDIQVELVGKQQAEDQTQNLPNQIDLGQNYPNPFNPSTSIAYTLSESMPVQLAVYNMNGQKVATLVNATQSAGSYNVNFDASNLASGLYIYRMVTPNGVITKKMTLMK